MGVMGGSQMTPDERERLAVVETRVFGMDKKLDGIDQKVDGLVSRFDRLDGGKRVLWALWLAVSALLGYLGSWFHFGGK